jgi:hypothetical protein
LIRPLVEGDQLPGTADLARVTPIEKEQMPGQRHHLQRVLAGAGGKQQLAPGSREMLRSSLKLGSK